MHLSSFCSLKQMVFVFLFATAFLEKPRIVWFILFRDNAIHVKEVLSEVADVVMLLASEDQNLSQESQRKSHVECFEGKLLNFFCKRWQRVLKILKALWPDNALYSFSFCGRYHKTIVLCQILWLQLIFLVAVVGFNIKQLRLHI